MTDVPNSVDKTDETGDESSSLETTEQPNPGLAKEVEQLREEIEKRPTEEEVEKKIADARKDAYEAGMEDAKDEIREEVGEVLGVMQERISDLEARVDDEIREEFDSLQASVRHVVGKLNDEQGRVDAVVRRYARGIAEEVGADPEQVDPTTEGDTFTALRHYRARDVLEKNLSRQERHGAALVEKFHERGKRDVLTVDGRNVAYVVMDRTTACQILSEEFGGRFHSTQARRAFDAIKDWCADSPRDVREGVADDGTRTLKVAYYEADDDDR